ncbi:MAG TPA: rhodanese-like domain-containing protein [Thermomicrobiales bacterium]|jgi:rhodanese-related sulfurtransferase|nr:rhodanese-like domain-containing protein [Thermomicrobiales bacterium]
MPYSREANLPPMVSAGELARTSERVAIIDVRSPAEFASEHIPGSFNVPLDQLAEHAERLGDAAQGPVVLVCRSGARAHRAERTLSAAALDNVHVLDGGLAAWDRARRPLVKGRRRWAMDRQVRGAAGALVLIGALGGLLIDRNLGWLAALVGGGLTFSAISDTCAMAKVLGMLPYNKTAQTCDVAAALMAMSRRSASVGAD